MYILCALYLQNLELFVACKKADLPKAEETISVGGNINYCNIEYVSCLFLHNYLCLGGHVPKACNSLCVCLCTIPISGETLKNKH